MPFTMPLDVSGAGKEILMRIMSEQRVDCTEWERTCSGAAIFGSSPTGLCMFMHTCTQILFAHWRLVTAL